MKYAFLTTCVIILLCLGCANGNGQFSLASAHPNAKAVMKEDFYWNPAEETAPFGSDDGSDAAYSFRDWRGSHKTSSPVVLKQLITEWNYPYFNYNEMDTAKIKAYIHIKANPDEAYIQQQVQQLKEGLQKSPDPSLSKTGSDDSSLRKVVIESSENMGASFLVGQDNAIIGIAFAQFVLEGTIDKDIKDIAIIAIQRELLPMLIKAYEEDYQQQRVQELTKMLNVINQAGTGG